MNEQLTPKSEPKKRCTFCLVVRYFAATIFISTCLFYFFNKYQQSLITEKAQTVEEATLQADSL